MKRTIFPSFSPNIFLSIPPRKSEMNPRCIPDKAKRWLSPRLFIWSCSSVLPSNVDPEKRREATLLLPSEERERRKSESMRRRPLPHVLRSLTIVPLARKYPSIPVPERSTLSPKSSSPTRDMTKSIPLASVQFPFPSPIASTFKVYPREEEPLLFGLDITLPLR